MPSDNDNPKALAEIVFEQGWDLSSAGTANPLRYWSHAHFEDDPNWGREHWTLFVELEKPPEPSQNTYRAKVFFMAPTAPHHFLRPGQKFDLCVGPMIKARGVIKELIN
jgi:hypothetical protein